MKENYVNVCFVVDQSGSMHGSESDVIGGFQKVIEEQRVIKEGKCTVSVFKFEDEVEVCFVGKDVNEVGELQYSPGGCTALNDAVCVAVDRMGEWLAAMPEEERPAMNMVVVITDGMENASRRFSHNDVKQRIQHQEEVYNWKFVYLGANITDAQEAQDLGFQRMAFSAKDDLADNLSGFSNRIFYKMRAEGLSSIKENLFDEALNEMTENYEEKLGHEIKNKKVSKCKK